jgi:glycosyltransferase involved in cell wall biosynthesis
MGGTAPYIKFANINKPLVTTVHGASPFALPMWVHYSTIKSAIQSRINNYQKLRNWNQFRNKCTAFISVSIYGKTEIVKYLGLNEKKITPIWHGVNLDVFKPEEFRNSEPSYFLHVSQYQPLKNIKRIIKAYEKLSITNKPALIIVATGYPPSLSVPKGVKVIREAIKQRELAVLYSGALALVNCSLRESFGMIILEAMACGCPVITSNTSALPEVAGDAALLVNPKSIIEIATAMETIIADESLQCNLREKGFARAQQFTWKRSADKHLEVFEWVLRS